MSSNPPEQNPELTLEEKRQVEFSDGWRMLGNFHEAERELDQIEPDRAGLPQVFSKRWMLYDEAGWKEKRDALTPAIRKTVWKCTVKVVRAAAGVCRALLREGWRRMRGERQE